VTRQGHGYVDLETGEPGVVIDSQAFGDAVHGDLVEVRSQAGNRGKRPQGVIVSVLERAERRLGGRVSSRDESAWFHPADARFRAAPMIGAGAPAVERAVAVLCGGRRPGRPRYRFLTPLSDGLDPRHDTTDIAHELGLALEFAANIERAARTASELGAWGEPRRWDLSNLRSFTIDPEDAQDFDDALSWRRCAGDIEEVGIHIADVGWYVQPGSELDLEARERGTSVYLPGLTLPMLPEALSGDAASLRPGEERAAVSILVRFDRDGRLLDWQLSRSVIRSRHRLTYAEAENLLEAGAGDALGADLSRIARLGRRLRRQRRRRALDLNLPETRVVLDDYGLPAAFEPRVIGPAHQLVEEMMLLANRLVGDWGRAARLPILFRVHERPRWQKLLEFALVLDELGIRTAGRDLSQPAALLKVQQDAAARGVGSLVSIHLLRALEKARYSADDCGHYGLGMEGYCHFTSPIRRYPDLHTHRVVVAAAAAVGGCNPTSRGHRDADRRLQEVRRRYGTDLAVTAELATAREIIAEQAERLALKVKVLRALEPRVGEAWQGVISGVTTAGFYVRLDDMPIEGFVPRTRLAGSFRLGPRGQSLEDRYGAPGFGLGQRLTVRLERVSIEQRDLELALLGGAPREVL
jgi:ribonuclease R